MSPSSARIAPESEESGLRVEYKMLLEAVRTIASSLDLDTVLKRLLYLSNELLGFDYCTILLIGEDGSRLDVAARYGYPDSIVQKLELAVGRGVTGRVAESGTALIVPDVTAEERYLAGLRGARSELVVPIRFEERVIGVVDVQSPKVGAFTERDRESLTALADVASVAITNARNHAEVVRSHEKEAKRTQLERQLNLGRVIQERLLPGRDPAVSGYEIAGMNLPSETISGDYFDYTELPFGNVGIAVADVSGKGVPAALLAASLQAMLRAHAENVYSIAAIIERVNHTLYRTTSEENFATLFYGVFDPDGYLTYVNAGHNPPIVLRHDGRTQRLTAGGPLLGMFDTQAYSEGRVELHANDYVIMYTDGVSEASRGDAEFGETGIVDTAMRVIGAPPRVVASVLITEAASFSRLGSRPNDDMTVVVASRLPV